MEPDPDHSIVTDRVVLWLIVLATMVLCWMVLEAWSGGLGVVPRAWIEWMNGP